MDKRQLECLNIYKETKRAIRAFEKDNILYWKKIKDYSYFKEVMSEEEFKETQRFVRNRYYKRYRANKKIEPIIKLDKDRLVFITCTFNDEQLKLKEETRTKKIDKWLKEHFVYSVANIDYGKKTEREHHHAVGYLYEDEELEEVKRKLNKEEKEFLNDCKSKSGYALFELKNKNYKDTMKAREKIFEPTIIKVRIDTEDIKQKRLSNYLAKLNNHTNKVSTRNRRLRVLY